MLTLRSLCCSLLVAFMLFSAAATAENRALLVGVGKYALSAQGRDIDLPGIDLDIDMMRQVSNHLGFQSHQIKVLLDEEATLANIERALQEWLVDGVEANDQTLFYFSGHGSQTPDTNGDEADGSDEVLTTFDMGVTRQNGRATLTNVLVDDRLQQLLAMIPSRRVLMLVDACHSGTSYKNLTHLNRHQYQADALGAVSVPKIFQYDEMPATAGEAGYTAPFRGSIAITARPRHSGGFVSLAAAADNEQAQATNRGSGFTLGVHRAVLTAAQQQGAQLTPLELHRSVTAYVAEKFAQARFHPQLGGNEALYHDNLLATSQTGDGHGPIWGELVQLARRGDPLNARLSQRTLRLGQEITISIDLPFDGYLNIVNVGPRDEPTILFPNRFSEDNRVSAGRFDFPRSSDPFALSIGEPLGDNIVAIFLSTKPINFYRLSTEHGKDETDSAYYFRPLSALGIQATRGSIAIKERPRERMGAAIAEFTVTR